MLRREVRTQLDDNAAILEVKIERVFRVGSLGASAAKVAVVRPSTSSKERSSFFHELFPF